MRLLLLLLLDSLCSSLIHKYIFSISSTRYITSIQESFASYGKTPSVENPLSQRWYRAKQQHLSPAQKLALRTLFPKFGIILNFGDILDPYAVFGSISDVNTSMYTVLDVGFGTGESIVQLALKNPSKRFIGVEFHRAGIATVLQKIEEFHIQNTKIIRLDFSILVRYHLVKNCIDEMNIFFPDPWPNDIRDKEKRVVRLSMVKEFSEIIKLDGLLHISTDVDVYVTHVKEVIAAYNTCPKSTRIWTLISEDMHINADKEPSWRPVTKYALKAREEGRPIWDLEYKLLLREVNDNK